MRMLCVWRTCLYESVCVCECVFLVVSEFLLIIIIPFSLLFLSTKSVVPPGHVTKPFLASVTQ